MPLEILGVTLLTPGVAEYLFASVFTCAVVNLVTGKISDKDKEMLTKQMIGKNHDIQQAMEKAFRLAAEEFFDKWDKERKCGLSMMDKAIEFILPYSDDKRKENADNCKKLLLDNTKRILFGDNATGLNDEKIRELILPEKTEVLTAEKIQKAKKHANQNFNRLIEPHIANAPRELRELFRKDLLNRTVFYFREEIKGNERVFRILALDAIGDLKTEFKQGIEKFSDLWCKSDEKLDVLITDLSGWRKTVDPKLDKVLSELAKLYEILSEIKTDREVLKKICKASLPNDFAIQADMTLSSVIHSLSDIPPQNGAPLPFVFLYLLGEAIGDVKLKDWIKQVRPELVKPISAQADSITSQKPVTSLLVRLIPDPNNRIYKGQEVFDFDIHEWRESGIGQSIHTNKERKKEDILEELDEIISTNYDDENIRIEFFLPYDLISLDVDGWKKKEDDDESIRLSEYRQIIVRIDRYRKKTYSKFNEIWKEKWNSLKIGNLNDQCVLCECDHQSYDAQKLRKKFIASEQHTCLMMTFLPSESDKLGFAILSAGIPVALLYRKSAREVECHQKKKDEIMQIFKDGNLTEIPKRVLKIRRKASGEDDLGNHLTLLWDEYRPRKEFILPSLDDSKL